jgi:hypothetical protein
LLTASNPAHTRWKHDLSVTYMGIGWMRQLQDDLPAALDLYWSTWQITKELTPPDDKCLRRSGTARRIASGCSGPAPTKYT